MKKTGIIAGIIIAILLIWGISSYNGLVNLNEKVSSDWSQIDNQLKRRADLIPNLVATVKGFASQEQSILNNIAESRSKLMGAQGIAEKAQANEELTSSLSRLLVVVENYPNLKSDATFRQLMDDISGTENRIAVARMDYNDSVRTFNTKIKTLPNSLWAGIMGFSPYEYYQITDSDRETPQVDFSN